MLNINPNVTIATPSILEITCQLNKVSLSALDPSLYPNDAQKQERERFIEENFVQVSDVINREQSEYFSGLLEKKVDNLSELRERFFELHGQGTDQVHGILRGGFTLKDRDNYIRELIDFDELTKEIKVELIKRYGDIFTEEAVNRMTGRALLSSDELRGDFIALKHLSVMESGRLPDLTYNKGTVVYD